MKAGTFKVLTVFALLALTQSAPATAQSAAPSSFFGTAGRADEVSFSGLKSFEQYQASIVFIEPHYGRTASVATGVSDDGSVVVGYSLNAQGDPANGDASTQRAFRWTASTGTQDLGSLGLERTWANAVSGDGRVVVGGYYVGSYAWRPYRWVLGVGMQDLGTLGTDWSDAHDVSNDGSVVVGSSYGDCNLGYWGVFAWRWTQQTGLVCLGTLPGYRFTHGHGTSADGSVVVGETNRDWAPQWHESEAWRWTPESGMQGLGLLPPWGSSVAQDVSDNGAVVIGLLCNDHDYVDCWEYPYRSFWWRADVGMRDLGTLGGDQTSVWHAVTRDGGMVFGGSRTASGEWHAFRWTPERGMEDLNVLYASVIPSGWTLGAVSDSSPDGRYLVGWAKGPNGIIRAFLLSVESGPLPGIATLFPELSPSDPLHQVILRGQVDPQGGAVQVWFEWGTDPTLATYQITGTQTVAGEARVVTATLHLTDSIGVLYYYRVAGGDPANPNRGSVEPFLLVLGRPNRGEVTSRPYWNKFDRLIHTYAHRAKIPPTIVKAIVVHESTWVKNENQKPERTSLYELVTRDWIMIHRKGETPQVPDAFRNYLLPDHPGDARYNPYRNEEVTIRQGTKNLDMVGGCWMPGFAKYDDSVCKNWRELNPNFRPSWNDLHYYQLLWGITNAKDPITSVIPLTAQYRLASSYGLGHVVYWDHFKEVPNPPKPESLWDPEFNLQVATNYLSKLRNKCLGNHFTETTYYNDITRWERAVRAYNSGVCGSGYEPDAWANIKNFFNKYVQPELLHRGNFRGSLEALAAGILGPSRLLTEAGVEMAKAGLQSAGEYEADRLVADFKGTGQNQLAVLVAVVVDPAQGVDHGVLRIFRDTEGTALEWESPPMEGVLASGVILVNSVSGGGAPLVVAYWGAGAHGTRAYLFRWDGQTFRQIYGMGQDGQLLSSFFGDAGVDIGPEGLWTGMRDGLEPLGLLHFDIYSWNAEAQRMDWARTETISLRNFLLYLPLVLRNQ